MGKIRSAADIAPWGPYISLSLADTLKQATKCAFGPLRSWWMRGKVRFSKRVIADLRLLSETLTLPEFSPIWSCYLGLLVPRDPTHSFLLDASYEGVGGWSLDFRVKWRLTLQDLIDVGFNMKVVAALTGEPNPDQAGLHINPLEFLACIINLWLFLCLIRREPQCATGYILDLISDNTSALSWLKVTAMTKDLLLQPLACFASALIIKARTLLTRVQPKHIPGKDNIEADALSRYTNGHYRSWADITAQCSRLQTCRICLLPRKLLSVLADLSSSRPIEGTYDDLATSRLMPELDFLPDGSDLLVIRSSLPPL